MLATHDIEKDEEVAYIPRSMMVYPEDFRSTEYYKQFAEVEGLQKSLASGMTQVALVMLEASLDPLSEYRGFVALEPKRFDQHVPLWTFEEMKIVENTDLGA